MATTQEYIEYVCEQISKDYMIRYRKMFGEYMVYVNDKPVLLVCNNTVFVKILDCIKDQMKTAERACPYAGSKEHYILPIDDTDLTNEVISILEKVIPVPKKK